MEETITFSIDKDGFISQQCPACSGRFKVQFGVGSDQPISYCPYCSHHGRDCWWTPEQAEYISQSTQQIASELLGNELAKMAREVNQSSRGRVKMTTPNQLAGKSPKCPEELDLDLPIIEFKCCGETIKYFESDVPLSCVICGNRIE